MGNLLAELEQPSTSAFSERHLEPHMVGPYSIAGFNAAEWDPALPLRADVRPEAQLSHADECRLLGDLD